MSSRDDQVWLVHRLPPSTVPCACRFADLRLPLPREGEVMSATIDEKVCAPEECTHAYTCDKHAKKRAARFRELQEKVARVEALVSEAHDEYLSAASEARWLEQTSRERGEWTANAREAAEWRDRIQAALDGATS